MVTSELDFIPDTGILSESFLNRPKIHENQLELPEWIAYDPYVRMPSGRWVTPKNLELPQYRLTQQLNFSTYNSTLYLGNSWDSQISQADDIFAKVFVPAPNSLTREEFIETAGIQQVLSEKYPDKIVYLRTIGRLKSLDAPFAILDYVDKPNLEQRVNSGLNWSLGKRIQTIWNIAEILSLVHQEGYVYRDLSGRNVMYLGDSEVMLTDFGLAKTAEAASKPDPNTPVLGSPQFISRERIAEEPETVQTDVHALALLSTYVLIEYNMLPGFSTPEKVAQTRKLLNRGGLSGQAHASISQRYPDHYKRLIPVLEKGLAREK